MLEMRVGLTKVMIKRPRRIDGRMLSSVVGRRVEASTERRKTTDSVRETEMEFLYSLFALCALNRNPLELHSLAMTLKVVRIGS